MIYVCLCVFFAFKINNPILLYTVTPVLGNRQVHLCSHSMYNLKEKINYGKDFLIFAENSDFISSFHSMNLKGNRIQCDQKCFGNIMIGNTLVYSLLVHIYVLQMKPVPYCSRFICLQLQKKQNLKPTSSFRSKGFLKAA